MYNLDSSTVYYGILVWEEKKVKQEVKLGIGYSNNIPTVKIALKICQVLKQVAFKNSRDNELRAISQYLN